MHACIAAFSSGVPVYPIAYSRKFNGLFVETLEYSYMGDLISQSEEQFLDGLKSAFESRTMLKETIEDRMNTIVKEMGGTLKESLVEFLDIK
jgi:polysaccharide pyruvyl transferase WcaK-like protein